MKPALFSRCPGQGSNLTVQTALGQHCEHDKQEERLCLHLDFFAITTMKNDIVQLHLELDNGGGIHSSFNSGQLDPANSTKTEKGVNNQYET